MKMKTLLLSSNQNKATKLNLLFTHQKKQALIINLDRETYIKQYIKEADLMAMIYYINEYGE